jgi:lipopolysaccharide transport system permease protein
MATQDILVQESTWDIIIRPQRAWWDLRLGDLWRYRDLIRLMVWRDFIAVYKQTILGPVWHLIQPLLTTVVFTIIFGSIAKLPTDGLPPFLFYMAGNTVWGYFSTCLLSTSNTFTSNAGIFGKVYFPRLAVPISIVISNLIAFAIRFGLFFAFLGYFALTGTAVRITAWIFMLPVLILLMAGLGLGGGIIISSLTTKYRDLQHLATFGVQLFMYASPVIYPLSGVPAKWQWLLLANPLTPIIEVFRLAFLGTSSVNPLLLLYSAGCTALVLLVGILVFNHVENTFMDTV